MSKKIAYLMRGLPSCGKSHTAKTLVGESGAVFETDDYFYSQVGNDPTRYDFARELLDDARRWSYEGFKKAVRRGISPIVVDRGNSLNLESHVYARFAWNHDYRVELREPESPWWQEIRVLLKYKRTNKPVLSGWARQLSQMSGANHRVPVATIEHWMDRWKWDVTIEDILNYRPSDTEIDRLFRDFLVQDIDGTVNVKQQLEDPKH